MADLAREGFSLIPSPPRRGRCEQCGKDDEVRDIDLVTPEKEGRLESLCTRCIFSSGILHIPTKDLPVEEVPVRAVSQKHRKRVAQQERALAEAVGGRTQPASGALVGAKGDVRLHGYFRIECKSTVNKSFRLTREILDKITVECGAGEEPAVEILFLHPNTMVQEDRWICLKAERFEGYVAYVTRNHR